MRPVAQHACYSKEEAAETEKDLSDLLSEKKITSDKKLDLRMGQEEEDGDTGEGDGKDKEQRKQDEKNRRMTAKR